MYVAGALAAIAIAGALGKGWRHVGDDATRAVLAAAAAPPFDVSRAQRHCVARDARHGLDAAGNRRRD